LGIQKAEEEMKQEIEEKQEEDIVTKLASLFKNAKTDAER